jgi:uncharacterized protein
LLDVLRALAMLGVIVVNAISYREAPWGPSLGSLSPAGSAAPLVAHGLIAWLLYGKAYPLLAFLFGAGLVLAAGDGEGVASRQLRQQRRLRRLLALGVVHGALIYFGDILTVYALCGFTLWRHVREPLRALRSRLRRACGWAVGALLLQLVLAVAGSGAVGWSPDPTGFAQVTDWAGQLGLNLPNYLILQGFGLLLFVPLLRAAMLAGMLAARLRLLTHRRWRPTLQRWLRRTLPLGMALNLLYAVGLTWSSATGDGLAEALWLGFGPCVGWLLTAGLVIAAALFHAGSATWLAPLGRRTLSLYVGHSVLCVVLFSGAGLGLSLGTVGWLGWGIGLWLLALLWAQVWERLGWRGPLEAWMARA